MARCVSCGSELLPERAEKYDYCTRPECQAENARGVTIVSVGVNKAADQFVILTDHAKDELASGKYQDPRRGSFGDRRPRRRTSRSPMPGATNEARPEKATAREPWSQSQQDRALSLHVTGRKPLSEIARQLGVSERTVARMLSAALTKATK